MPYEYVGTKKCKMCHTREYESWAASAKGSSWDALKPGVNVVAKIRVGLHPDRNYTREGRCLVCHAVGFGLPGGYEAPRPDDDESARLAANRQGVGCESCHGPGGGFTLIMRDILRNERRYRDEELMAAGLNITGVGTCTRCHTQRAPCIEPGYTFAREQGANCGSHVIFPRKYRDPEQVAPVEENESRAGPKHSLITGR